VTDLDRAIDLIIASLRSGGTVFCCGNGGSDAHAGHLVAELVGRYAYDRMPLAAVHISASGPVGSALANDYGWDRVFSRQVGAYVRRWDVLLVLTTSGKSANVMRAVAQARMDGTAVVALTGPAGLVGAPDDEGVITVRSTATTTPVIQEEHQRWVHEIARRVEEAMCPK
jgi:D-sedoheptulose 7-phosphate isomerase